MFLSKSLDDLRKRAADKSFSGIFVDFSKKLIIIVIRMDMHKTGFMAISQVAARMRGHKILVGAKRIRKSIGMVREVFLAHDADPAVTQPLAALCEEHKIPWAWVASMTELGRICGIEVKAAAAAYTD